MNEIKTICITGFLGFIGSYVTSECLKQGWYVYGIDKLTYASRMNLLSDFREYGDHFKYEISDINNIHTLPECDYVINLAAETHVDNSIISNTEFIDSNIKGVHNILESIRVKNQFKMPTLLHFSTDETYGDIINGSHKETDSLNPSNPYSATKASADMLILAWSRTYNLPYIIVRPTNNYGIGQYIEKLIPKTCKYLLLGKRIPLHNNGTPRRTWLHAKDTAKSIITLINSNTKNEIYNIGGDYECTNKEVVSKIANIFFNKNINLNDICDFSYNRLGQDVRYSLDDNKIRNLGWSPTCIFDEELPSIVDFYKNKFIW